MPSKTIKMEQVERLTRGKRSGANIGSRNVGHQLRAFEREIYDRALQARYLIVSKDSRENLWNVWVKVANAKKWSCLILVKETRQDRGEIFQDEELVYAGELAAAKIEIRRLAKALNV